MDNPLLVHILVLLSFLSSLFPIDKVNNERSSPRPFSSSVERLGQSEAFCLHSTEKKPAAFSQLSNLKHLSAPTGWSLNCEEGIENHYFEVNRTTFGFVDTDYTVPFPASEANTKVGLPCDRVTMEVISTVAKSLSNDSLGMAVRYTNPNGLTSAEQLFLFEDGQVRIVHGGLAYSCDLALPNLTVQTAGPVNTLTFDLTPCVAGLGFALVEGDSIDFSASFSINPAGPITNDFLEIPQFNAFGFVTVGGENIVCDSISETFRVGRTRALFDYPNPMQGASTGCKQIEWPYRLFVPENDFADFFGNEYRAAQKIDSFVLDFNPVLLSAYTDLTVSVSIPGHPIHGNNFFPIRPLTDFPSGHYVATFDTLTYVPTLNVVTQYSFDLKIQASPNCLTAQQPPINLGAKIYYQDRYYANNIGSAGCALSKFESGNSQVSYANPPQIEMTLLSSPFDTVQAGQADWTVEICNISPISNADLVWFAIEDLTGNLNVLAVENITDPQNPVNIPLSPYGANNWFSYAPSLSSSECVQLRLTANVNGCQNLNFDMKSGWNCTAFPDPDWTPADNVCAEENVDLVIVNIVSSPIQLSFNDVTSVCQISGETVSITGQLSTGSGTFSDNFTIKFFHDVNGDGILQITEPVVFQQNFFGNITPVVPLGFTANFPVTAVQSCQLIAVLEAAGTDLCAGVELAVPAPQLRNAGADRFFCELYSPNIDLQIGDAGCTAPGYNFSWTAVPPASINHINDPQSAVTNLSLNGADFLGETLTYILETERTACGISTFDTISITLPNTPEGYFGSDKDTIQVANCQSVASFCLGISQQQIGDFSVWLDNQPYPSTNFLSCNGNEVAVLLSPGSHQLVLTNPQVDCSDTIEIQVNCTQSETVDLTFQLHESATVCLNSLELTGPIVSLTNLCEDGTFVNYEILNDTCVVLSGMFVGTETACFIACDINNFCDTTFINTTVLHPIPNGITDTMIVSAEGEYCFNANLLNIAGDIFSIENICPQSGASVDFFIDPIDNCIFYEGLSVGTDTACVRVCDEFDNCDTVIVAVTVLPGFTAADTIFISVDTNTFCIDDQLLPGNLDFVENICPTSGPDQVNFTINGNCVSYFSDAVGTDTACLRIVDELGNIALIELVVTVVQTIPETVCDDIFIGEIVEFCLDTTELPGIFSNLLVLFDNNQPNNVSFDPNPVSLCVRYEGLNIGLDSFTIAVCDNFGFCDTTSFCITVAPYFSPPGLTNDTTRTIIETPVAIDPLSNDTVFGGIVDYFILFQPISGTAQLNLDGSITYTPDPVFCDREDEFTYVVCNPNGCDTALVNIYIECVELTVFNAVSPNNDEVNDYFYISKIENFPNNRLWVYNRWGSLVFDSGKEGYKNNWPGTWGDETDLPDGTYYYILEWSDNGTTNVQRGYIEMVR